VVHAVGGWIALVFALRPLLALRNVSPLQTLRRDTDAEVLRIRMRWSDLPRIAVDVALVLSVVGIAFLRARTTRQALWMSAATGFAILALVASAALLSWAARRGLRTGWPYVVRQGVANLYRPGNQTRAVVLALGFGAFLVSTLYLVQHNILRRFTTAAAESRGNVVFFDVQQDQAAGLDCDHPRSRERSRPNRAGSDECASPRSTGKESRTCGRLPGGGAAALRGRSDASSARPIATSPRRAKR